MQASGFQVFTNPLKGVCNNKSTDLWIEQRKHLETALPLWLSNVHGARTASVFIGISLDCFTL